MIKRFFTKKSVAIIFTTFLMVGYFCFYNNASAIDTLGEKKFNEMTYEEKKSYARNQLGDKLNGMSLYEQGNAILKQMGRNDDEMSDKNVSTKNFAEESSQSLVGGGGENPNFLWKSVDFFAGIAALPFFISASSFLYFLSVILSGLVALAGLIFDISINVTIIGIKNFFVKDGVVSIIWTLIRDMLNVSFIFILLYEAISMIIGVWGVKSRTTISKIILSAIFINFSLFVTKIIIDASNLVAIQFYNLIHPKSMGFSISEMILSGTGISGFLNSVTSLSGQTNMIMSLVLQIICISILIWIFVYFAMVIIGRTVMLVFLAMTSPIAFMGDVLPELEKHSKEWWTSFNQQILVAPFLMFFLFFLTKIIESKTLSNVIYASENTSKIDVNGLFIYIILIILLLQGLKMVKTMSGAVGEWPTKIIGTALTAGVAVATGGTAIAGGALLGAGTGTAAGTAALAGKTGLSRLGTRLALSTKSISETGIGKFVTGEHKKTGILGMAQTFGRGKIMEGVKVGTGGLIDIKKEEDLAKKRREEAKKNIEEEIEKIGPKKAKVKVEEIKTTLANIIAQAKKSVTLDVSSAEATRNTAKTDRDDAQTNLKTDQANLVAAITSKVASTNTIKTLENNITNTENLYKTANENFTKADQKVEDYKNMKKAENFEDEIKNLKNSKDQTEETQKEKEREFYDNKDRFERAKLNFGDKAELSAAKTAFDNAKGNLNKANVAFAKIDQKLQDFVDYNRDLETAGEIIAKDIGLKETIDSVTGTVIHSALETLKEELKTLKGTIPAKIGDQRNAIRELAEKGSVLGYLDTLLLNEEREKEIKKLRTLVK